MAAEAGRQVIGKCGPTPDAVLAIRGGRSICPHEVEGAVGAVPGVRPGCIAVFESPDPDSGTERLFLLAGSTSHDFAILHYVL